LGIQAKQDAIGDGDEGLIAGLDEQAPGSLLVDRFESRMEHALDLVARFERVELAGERDGR